MPFVILLAVFAKLRIATIGLSCLFVCPHGHFKKNLIFEFFFKFEYFFFKKYVQKMQVSLKSDKNKGHIT